MNDEKTKELERLIHSDFSGTVGIVVQKGGRRVYERYFNGYAPCDAVHVYSVTKSIFSALVGIAIEKGCLKGVDQKVFDFFPDYPIPEGEKAMQQVTSGDMLTMTAPYKYDTEPYEAFFMSENWLTFALDQLGGENQTGQFAYSAMVGTHILSGILAKAVGGSVLHFAKEHLFTPLDIQVPCNIQLRTKEEHMAAMSGKTNQGWAVDPQGINPAGWGLFLTPADMAKFGQLYLDGGVYGGKQVVPSWWVAESAKVHSRWGELSYGYLWWVINGDAQVRAALGDGGNAIYVNPDKKLVVAIAARFTPQAKDPIGLIQNTIEPLFAD